MKIERRQINDRIYMKGFITGQRHIVNRVLALIQKGASTNSLSIVLKATLKELDKE